MAKFLSASETLEKRIAHTNPDSNRVRTGVHGGAGTIQFQGLLDSSTLNTNLLLVHTGVILPKGGIGHHFHHRMEEMYVTFEGEAEFTINGRTSRLKGPVAVPCKLGQSHGIYNPTDKPIRWLNVGISLEKGEGDSFDLKDDRVGVPLDPKPVFVSSQLDRKRLSSVERYHGGQGTVHYNRVLSSVVFRTSWAYVDHLIISAGASIGPRALPETEEIFYVIRGTGLIQVNGEEAAIKEGDAIPVRFNESQSITNKSETDLELLIIGIAKDKE